MSKGLKKCPFCGSKEIYITKNANKLYDIRCINYRNSCGFVIVNFLSEENAIKAWNRRA